MTTEKRFFSNGYIFKTQNNFVACSAVDFGRAKSKTTLRLSMIAVQSIIFVGQFPKLLKRPSGNLIFILVAFVEVL